MTMGGHALSKESVRLAEKDYRETANDVLRLLSSAMPNRKVAEIRAYASKESFGDLDVLVEGGQGYSPVDAAASLSPLEIVRNGPVTSVGIAVRQGMFQVDLIKVPPESFEFAERYFAMNDLGNLLGRIAHKAGFKLGHEGLFFVVRDDERTDHVVNEIAVTRDWDSALRFFGYDPAKYEIGFAGGFKNLRDVFEFAVSSPYSNRDIYLLENRNAKARMRDRKRKTYMDFLDWLEEQPPESLPSYEWESQSKEVFLSMAKNYFPEFAENLASPGRSDWERECEVRRRFNGSFVSDLTGKTGKDLGNLMRAFRERFQGKTEFADWVLSASDKELSDSLIAFSSSVPADERMKDKLPVLR